MDAQWQNSLAAKIMTIDRRKLYVTPKDFFDLDGSAVMKLGRDAATELCQKALAYELLIVKIEGGIWRDATFEARLDAIWDGREPPIANNVAKKNNLQAASFIDSCDKNYNAFIITVISTAGYLTRQYPSLAAIEEKA